MSMAEHMELPIIEEINGRYLASINAHYVTDEDARRIKQKIDELRDENTKLRTLCRDMYLVVELLDMDGMKLQAHGKDADWRTLKERFEELAGIEVD